MSTGMFQKILTVTTDGNTLRSEIVGWTCESAALWRPGPIGATPSPRGQRSYGTPLEAMADGWTLMAPPTSWEDDRGKGGRWTMFEWWFTRTESAMVAG